MSANASAAAESGGDVSDEKIEEYEEMLSALDSGIEEAVRKIESGRVYSESKESIRIKWIRALAYTINVRRQVTNDRDLAELAEEVDELKAAAGMEGDR